MKKKENRVGLLTLSLAGYQAAHINQTTMYYLCEELNRIRVTAALQKQKFRTRSSTEADQLSLRRIKMQPMRPSKSLSQPSSSLKHQGMVIE